MLGCSRTTPSDVAGGADASTSTADAANTGPRAESVARVAQGELGTEHWVVSNWSEKDLDHPLPESEAGLDVVDAGVRVTTFDRRGQAHVIHRRELLDEFEIKVRIVQPSVEELIAEGMPRPSVFSSRVGVRGAEGNPSLRVSLRRNRNLRETDDVTLRASSQQLSFKINDDPPRVMRRHNMSPVHFFVELSKNSQVLITNLEIREGLEPDPELVAASENATGSTPVAGGPMMMPPGFAGPMSPGFPGPMSPMLGPGFGGVAPTAAFGKPPSPSRLAPLLSQGRWSVPGMGNATVDAAIAGDMRLELTPGGLSVAKTSASGGFWLTSEVRRTGDFVAQFRVTVPSTAELASIVDPTTLLAVGTHAADGAKRELLAQAPPPVPTGPREFDVKVRRDQGQVTLDVAGVPVGGNAMIDQQVVVGLFVRGGIRFSIHDFKVTPPEDEPTGSDLGAPTRAQPAVMPPATRVWTDAGGTRQITATFVKLEGDKRTSPRRRRELRRLP